MLTALFALVVLVPLIGSYGLWDPHELPLAGLAREVARTGDYASVLATRPPLAVWLSALGVSLLGPSELGARLPHAILGIVGALATYGIGRRLRNPRTGLLAAVVLVAPPLYLFQARQLTSDTGGVAGSAIAMYGLIGLAWPGARPTLGRRLVDAGALLVGLTLAFLAQGAVLGVGLPLAALALASSGVAIGALVQGERLRRQMIVAAVATLLAAALLVYWFAARDHKGYLQVLGGAFRAGDDAPANATFDYLVNQLAFGLFPWSALAPVAVVRLLLVRRADRNTWGGLLVIAWASAAYVLGTLWMREMGDLRYPGLVPIALAVAVLLDDLLSARSDEPTRWPAATHGLPLLGLFVLCASVQLGRDIKEFPEQLAAVHLLSELKFPAVVTLPRLLTYAGLLFGLLAAFGMATSSTPAQLEREPLDRTGLHAASAWLVERAGAIGRSLRPALAPAMRFLRRFGLTAAVSLGALIGLFLALVYTPTLSQHFSYKNVFDSYRELQRGDEPLAVWGIAGAGPEFYARGRLERLNDVAALSSFFRRDGRVFAVVPSSNMCPVHQSAVTSGFADHVVSDENSRFFLYSNRLAAGERDHNPLARVFAREAPAHIAQPIAASFKPASPGQRGDIELLGVDMPSHVEKGSTFTMKLYFKVNERPSASYKVLVHFDKNQKFNGDHKPINDLCATTYWQAGDYVTDTFEVTAGHRGYQSGTYQVFTGLFTGSYPTWTNMHVASGNGTNDDRVSLGQITVD